MISPKYNTSTYSTVRKLEKKCEHKIAKCFKSVEQVSKATASGFHLLGRK